MKMTYLSAVACLLIAATAWPGNAPPSDKSIQELLDVTNARQLLDSSKEQLNGKLAAEQQAMMRGRPMTPERQAISDRTQTQMLSVIDGFFDWDAMLPMYLRLYRETFTEDELKGMLKFYKTPAGQAMTKKMPLLMHNVLDDMQQMMKPAIAKLARIQQEAMQELKELPDH
jgi:hypothetical protein